jgi:hypothetical protein
MHAGARRHGGGIEHITVNRLCTHNIVSFTRTCVGKQLQVLFAALEVLRTAGPTIGRSLFKKGHGQKGGWYFRYLEPGPFFHKVCYPGPFFF